MQNYIEKLIQKKRNSNENNVANAFLFLRA